LNDFFNPLAATGNHRLGGRHRLEIDTSQTFIGTGKRKNCATTHGFGDVLTILLSQKANPMGDV
jgi:hypothetical protein